MELKGPPGGSRAHRPAVAELVEPAADEHVPAVLPLRDREHLKIIGLTCREILERVHRQVDFPCPERLPYGAGEASRAADLGQLALVLIARRRDPDDGALHPTIGQ